MSDEAAFLEVLKANPADDTARLVYADWLDEHDEPQKAQYLRMVVGLVQTCGHSTQDAPEPSRLVTLSAELPLDWREAIACRFSLVLYCYTNKIRAIKVVRMINGPRLQEAVEASESLPATICARRTPENVIAGLRLFLDAGAVARIHPMELEDLPELTRYQIHAELHDERNEWEMDGSFPKGATEAFTAFVHSARIGEQETDDSTEAWFAFLVRDLGTNEARYFRTELAQLLPERAANARWSISLHVTEMSGTPST